MTNQQAQGPTISEIFSISSRSPVAINALLRKAVDEGHLISPAAQISHVPDGWSLSMNVVWLNPDPDYGDVYPQGGKLAPSKVALDKISSAAGISWHPVLSRRLDDGREPRYCLFESVGVYKDFEGNEITKIGHGELDLRDDSDRLDAMHAEIKDPTKNADSQILALRKNILTNTETRARNRVVRQLGLRSSYQRNEIVLPFIVAKLAFTGESDDPEMRRAFAMLKAQHALGMGRALYGGDAQLPRLPTFNAPPVGGSALPNEGRDDDRPPQRAKPITVPADVQRPAQGQGATQRQPAPPPDRSEQRPAQGSGAAQQGGRSGSTPQGGRAQAAPEPARVPFGTHRNKLVSEFTDEQLDGWIGALQGMIADPAKRAQKAEYTAYLDAAVQVDAAREAKRSASKGGGEFSDDRRAPGKGNGDDDPLDKY